MSFRDWASSLLGRKSAPQALGWLPESWLVPEAKTGIAVSWKNALEVTTVLACARLIANGIAQVPLRAYDRSQSRIGRLKRVDHDLLNVIGWKPNPWQTSYDFLVTVLFHLLLTGNAFAFVNRLSDGRIVELLPIEPARVTVQRQPDLSLRYKVASEDGSRQADLGVADIWHLRGPSWNGWMGLDVVRLAREAVGLALATEEAHAKLHRNGAQPGGLYSIKGDLSAEQYEMLRNWIAGLTSGANRFTPMILDREAKWTPTRMSGVDAEHIATRKLQVEEVCRALGVFPMMVGSTEKAATFASAEQMFIAHVVHTLTPWARCIELSIEVNLLAETDDVDIRFDMRGLMRGASKDRAEYNAKALGSGGAAGWATPNEIREDEGFDWHPDGDGLPQPAATITADPNTTKEPA